MYKNDKIVIEQTRHFKISIEALEMFEEHAKVKDWKTVESYKCSSYSDFATIFTQELFINNDLGKAKNAAYNAASSIQFRAHSHSTLQHGPLSTAIFALFPLLSDHQGIIDDMKNWKGFYHDELVKKGAIWHMLQALLAGDETLANFHHEKTGKHAYKKIVAYHIERRCLKAILDKDVAALQAAIYEFLEPQIHKKFLDKHFLSGYFYSGYAMMYIKLAHQFNLQVNVEHELVPQALVPFQPLDNYELLYEFMRRSS